MSEKIKYRVITYWEKVGTGEVGHSEPKYKRNLDDAIQLAREQKKTCEAMPDMYKFLDCKITECTFRTIHFDITKEA